MSRVFHSEVRVHLDSGAGDFTVALCEMRIADCEAAPFDVARHEDRHPDLQVTDVHIASVLTRRKCSETVVFMRSVRTAYCGGRRVQGVRGKAGTSCCFELGLAGRHRFELLLAG